MSEIRKVEFPEKDQPLRADVSLLGHLVGDMLVEQHGQQLLDQVEQVRHLAIARRQDDAGQDDALQALLSELEPQRLVLVMQAFATYLRLANIAEKVHRIRRRRAYMTADEQPQRGSLAAVLGELRQSGVDAGDIAAAVGQLQIRPVFTAHPTEATRRVILEKELAIVRILVERLYQGRTDAEEQAAIARIRDAVTCAWQTRMTPASRPSVADELDNVLFYLSDVLYPLLPAFFDSLQQALGQDQSQAGAALGPDLLRFGSWVGGDMDGNPNVHGGTITETLATQRRVIFGLYLAELRKLGRYLSQSVGDIGFSESLLDQLGKYQLAYPELASSIPSRHQDMPYRCLLHYMVARLDGALQGASHAYTGPGEMTHDLELITNSLAENRGQRAGLHGVRRLQQRMSAFGWHLATLDIRQDALAHRQVLAELLDDSEWPTRPAEERTRLLDQRLVGDQLPELPENPSEQASRCLSVFHAIDQGRQTHGEPAIGLFIVSMTHGADDVLSVLLLARLAGLARDGQVPLDVAPLLETVDDLQAGAGIMETLFGLGSYRAHLQARQQGQVVMVGYSDSNKDSGIAAARWSLQQAQRQLTSLGQQHGIPLRFFHGRGGTVSRGGGNLVNGILGAPSDSVGHYLRLTEQGEVINQKYGVRSIALRNLELMTGATLWQGLMGGDDIGAGEDRELMSLLASASRQRYRSLVHEHAAFMAYFSMATPIDVIQQLAIGSRPASRRSGQGIGDLRAIPWVFSWAQTRVGLPGVYGVGTALEQCIETYGISRLRTLRDQSRYFGGLLSDVEMVLAKSDLDMGRRYSLLAKAEDREVFREIEQEFQRARAHVLDIRETDELLAGQATLKRNIRLRNPYVDPLHFVQIELLQRWREEGSTAGPLLDALKLTVHGIALGIQNTG